MDCLKARYMQQESVILNPMIWSDNLKPVNYCKLVLSSMTNPSKGSDTTLYRGANSFNGCYMLWSNDFLTGESSIIIYYHQERFHLWKTRKT